MDTARGVRDFPPEIQLIRDKLISTIKSVFELHGFPPLVTPVIERLETLRFKFSGDEDVMHELFCFSDRGNRKLGLRFDLTIPLCRFVSQNKDLKFPFKRYEVGRVYRDGPVKLGRYREFWQCDGDIVGSSSMLADAECIRIACSVLSQLQFNFVIKINNRGIIDSILEKLGVKDKKKVILLIDKVNKQGKKAIYKQLSDIIPSSAVDKLFSLLFTEGTDNGRIRHIEEFTGSCKGIDSIRELLSYLDDVANIEFDPSLARGLNYYTGSVYEGFLLQSPITSSVCAGGRYDSLIGQMRKDNKAVPAVGISFGIDPLTDALLDEKFRFDKTNTVVYVIPIKTVKESYFIVDRIRSRGINADIDLMGRSLSKNLDFASKQGIPYVIILGNNDLQQRICTIRNMKSGDEVKIPISEINTFDFDI